MSAYEQFVIVVKVKEAGELLGGRFASVTAVGLNMLLGEESVRHYPPGVTSVDCEHDLAPDMAGLDLAVGVGRPGERERLPD